VIEVGTQHSHNASWMGSIAKAVSWRANCVFVRRPSNSLESPKVDSVVVDGDGAWWASLIRMQNAIDRAQEHLTLHRNSP